MGVDSVATITAKGLGVENAEENTELNAYEAALADEPEVEVEAVEAEAPAEEEARPERERDEKGRYVARQPDPEPEPVVEAVKPDHRVPLAELMKERDNRQSAQRELDQLRQQMFMLQQQQAQKPQEEEAIDIFANPEAYQSRIQQTMEQRLKAMEGNFSLRLAAYKHGDDFHEAWKEMVNRTQNGDDSIRQQVMQSPDPGETLVQLYQREMVINKVGNDPEAYIQKRLDEALKDPAFLAKAIEAAKASAGAQPKPANKIELPPSLNKMAADHGETFDVSDRGMYFNATR
jgi:hypothetical protein